MDEPFGDFVVLLAAALLDLVGGDPPNRWHPVAAMGWLIGACRRRAPIVGRWRPLLAGLGIIALGTGLSIGVGVAVQEMRTHWPWCGFMVEIVLVKAMFSIRGLLSAAISIQGALVADDLDKARRLLSWHLVSRPTTDLDETRVAAAAIESVAENASDSIFAPWVFFLIGGLPAMLAYRFINTADAMLGYRDAEREWLGKIPARLDDVLNWLPARLTALLLIIAASLCGCHARRGLSIWRRDARLTASPNAGQSMAVAAGVLGVELEKVDHYRLGAGLRPATANDIGRAVRLVAVAVALGASFGAIVAVSGRIAEC